MAASSSVHRARGSYRGLARRLRRERRQELGFSRAQALEYRLSLLRRSLQVHWSISDLLGAHYSSFADALTAARIVGLHVSEEERDAHVTGNWARHRHPPGLCPPPNAPVATRASDLEAFRGHLYREAYCAHPDEMLAYFAAPTSSQATPTISRSLPEVDTVGSLGAALRGDSALGGSRSLPGAVHSGGLLSCDCQAVGTALPTPAIDYTDEESSSPAASQRQPAPTQAASAAFGTEAVRDPPNSTLEDTPSYEKLRYHIHRAESIIAQTLLRTKDEQAQPPSPAVPTALPCARFAPSLELSARMGFPQITLSAEAQEHCHQQ